MRSAVPRLSAFMQRMVIECAGLATPWPDRRDWIHEWRSELWYVRAGESSNGRVWAFCLGAFNDAFFIRRCAPKQQRPPIFQSPCACGLFLASISLLSLFVALLLPGARSILLLSLHSDCSGYLRHSWFGVSESPPNPIDQQIVLFRLTFALACLILPSITRLYLGSVSQPKSFRAYMIRSRWLAFLLLKVMLIMPMVYFAALDFGHLFTMTVPGSFFIQLAASFIGFLLSLRWVLNDQRRRCPTCLRLLSNPVRVGRRSWSLLDWNLTEYVCFKGHGVLHVPEASVSGGSIQRWISMDCTWSKAHR